MPISYTDATREVTPVLNDLRERYFPELDETEVTIGALFAYADGDNPAVKLHGYACAATIKVNSLKDRVEGKPDATITIDGKAWKEEWSEERRRAVMHHELQHIELQYDDGGTLKSDDHGRPKFKLRPHDWQLGGFASTASLFKEEAIEVQAAQQLRTEYGQLLLFDHDVAIPRSLPIGDSEQEKEPIRPRRNRGGNSNRPRAGA